MAFITLLGIPVIGQTAPASDKTASTAPYDLSNWFSLMAAAEGGGGFTSGPQATAYAGVKLGAAVTPPWTWSLDLGYDRLRGHNGFSVATTGMLPVFRYPGPQENDSRNYLRVYAGPGIGYRTAGGGFGPYLSANVMVALLSDKRLNLSSVSPYIEYQRRFPVPALTQGDNRISFGVLIALCNHCGLD